MPERFAEDLMRDLIEQIDARLREAKRLRNEAEQQYRDRPFWPDRRRTRRDADSQQPQPHNRTR